MASKQASTARKAAPRKAAPSKAAAKKAAPSKAATAKKAAPAKKASGGKVAPTTMVRTRAPLATADIKQLAPSAAYSEAQASRVGEAAGNGNAGYVVRWPNKAADILRRTEAAKGTGTLWRVRCNEHGTTKDVPDDSPGDRRYLSSREGRTEWCAQCRKAAK
jgi:hypothetical protein